MRCRGLSTRTSGAVWRVYNVHFDQPIEKILVCEVDLIASSAKSDEILECFGNLSREGFSIDLTCRHGPTVWNECLLQRCTHMQSEERPMVNPVCKLRPRPGSPPGPNGRGPFSSVSS